MHAQLSPEDSRLLHSIPPARVALIERIAQAASGTGGGRAAKRGSSGRGGVRGTAGAERVRPPSGLQQRFIRAYFRGVGEEDLSERPAALLARVAIDHLEFGSQRRALGESRVRVFNPDPARDGFECPHTLVMLVTDDMPFLIDSIGIIFSRADIAVHLIVHPVLEALRDGRGRLLELGSGADARAESWQLYEIDRQTDPARLESLQHSIEATLADVRSVVEDWIPMRQKVKSLTTALEHEPPPNLPHDEVEEGRQLLDWMEARHFVFLGYRHYRLQRGSQEDKLVADERSGLGISRRANPTSNVVLRGDVRARARDRELLILTKANSASTVHRGEYLDYVGLKEFDARGQVCGEHRFLGLWTSTAYHRSPRDIPVLRRKVQQVIAHFGLDPQSHDGKAVLNVLETYPRDELFQAGVDDLIRIARGIVNLYERRTVRLLVRRDPYHRFYSCLIYVPRDRYNTEVRQRIEQLVLQGFQGRSVETQVQISGSNHARVHVVVHTDPLERSKVDLAALEDRIADAALTWTDRLRDLVVAHRGEAAGLELATRYRHSFPLAYEEDVAPRDALDDLADLEALREQSAALPDGVRASALRLNLHRPAQQKAERVHLKIVKLGEPVPISDLLPMLENFGLRVISERPYELAWPQGGTAWIQDFEVEHRDRLPVDIAKIDLTFKEAFLSAWLAEIENDGFNRLLLVAGLSGRQIIILRAYCRYLLQTGVPFSQAYMERTLCANPAIARNLVRLFERRFDPAVSRKSRGGGDRDADKLVAQVRTDLDAVASLDEDRILRAYLHVIEATLRTNFYQQTAAASPAATPGAAVPRAGRKAARSPVSFAGAAQTAAAATQAPKSYLAVKLDPAKIPDLPLPRPKFEVFVYSPRVEAVHLRMGYVARGGIRWSDRREDFRTEILGLMKAQNVKNTLIVPVGAKGGFVCKRLPTGTREEVQAEVVFCYQTLIRGLLDLTDNIVGGRIVPPARVVRRDRDDAYLVVAADKGTATFSDIANALSLEYGYWLGDACASGGSAGYDHKKMAITARGAWECVKRHFREIGVDTQEDDFSVVGIGDMSGDVFGNGMLLSRHIRLLAAFDHRHIFLDPGADAAVGFAERSRLFKLPRSSWDDYDRKKLARGGGVFSRTAKSIALSAEASSMLGLGSGPVAPNDILKAILKMPADLLWNGGIGTYVKSSEESNAEVGDRANDALRINGCDLRVKVVGEGGNLGLSQRGRIEYALAGGRLNTDFIDNSAGVNTSDVEVNIKILLNPLVRSGKLARSERDKLLAKMTDEVAALVLRNNYLQSQAISTLEAHASARLAEYQHLIRTLERSGDLNRGLEFLPTDEELADRRKRGIGLTRPELAILLAYSKIWLTSHLLSSDVPEDAYLSSELVRYFPAPLQKRFARNIAQHELRREIITTATTNSLVNRMGPAFVPRAQEDTGAAPAQIARAYTAAREIFDMRATWAEIEALDTRVAARIQYSMAFQTARLMRHITYWLLVHRKRDLSVDAAVAEFRKGVQLLESDVPRLLVGADKERFDKIQREHLEAGVPAELATRVAGLSAQNAALDIVEVAAQHRVGVTEAARVYFEAGARVGLDWLRDQVEQLPVDGTWQAIARIGLRDGAMRIHRRIAERILARKESAPARVAAWLAAKRDEIDHWQRTLDDMRASGANDFASLSVGVESTRKLAD